ncbi:MAG: arginine deiminase-related protein [Acidobacteria bacterium]|nr:arginine deiminase-related protein [Acidobacteriota bacterium]
MDRCELTHLARVTIDQAKAVAQHHAYEQTLTDLGCDVVSLPVEPTLPDSVFVEDVAVVLDEIAVITRPGAISRRVEADAVAEALVRYRRVTSIAAPGTLEGGDVLRIGRRIFVGESTRSNASGIEQLRAVVWPYGYTVTGVPVQGCLHLKSAVTQVAPDTLLVNPAWVDARTFGSLSVIEVDPAEAYAANGLLVGSTLVYPSSFPGTRQRLEAHGIAVCVIDVSELQKAEGAVTCCSLIFTH